MQIHSTLSPIQVFFHNKWVRLIIIVDIIALITLIIILIWQTTKVSTINLDVTPLDSRISINGNHNYQNGQYSLTPGSYEITISHDNMTPKTFTVDIAPQTVVSVTTFLSDPDHTYDFYKQRTNYSSYQKLAEIASAENNLTTDHDTSAADFINKFQADYAAFSTKLPIEYRESEGYGSDRSLSKNITLKAKYDCQLTLCIQALVVGTDDKAFINSLLQEKGFNLEDFEIEYKFY